MGFYLNHLLLEHEILFNESNIGLTLFGFDSLVLDHVSWTWDSGLSIKQGLLSTGGHWTVWSDWQRCPDRLVLKEQVHFPPIDDNSCHL